ncbi:hypothetical protein JOB18_021425 [Solea senegalensis]|uniref:Uncharacterized protein n=1 Tax=Solea senegalensis TaxID=28829 RepID=A0AAV6SU71_SOLSE|nr:hypothetical protein JOB18_021425 [Solea senegalensis]
MNDTQEAVTACESADSRHRTSLKTTETEGCRSQTAARLPFMLSAALLCARICRAELWNRCHRWRLTEEPAGNDNVSCCNSSILVKKKTGRTPRTLWSDWQQTRLKIEGMML